MGEYDRNQWRRLRELPPFDPARTDYTESQLEDYASKILMDARVDEAEPIWLTMDQIRGRVSKEAHPVSGIPDPQIISAIFYRAYRAPKSTPPSEANS